MAFFEVVPMESNAQVRCTEIWKKNLSTRELGKHREKHPKQKQNKYDSQESKMNFQRNKLCKEKKKRCLIILLEVLGLDEANKTNQT